MRLTLLAVFGAAMALLVLGLAKGHAHEAASGWKYPFACCSAVDCYSISESDLTFDGDTVVIKATGERFLLPDVKDRQDVDRRAQWSGDRDHPDNEYHRCSANNGDVKAHSFCLFLPRPSI